MRSGAARRAIAAAAPAAERDVTRPAAASAVCPTKARRVGIRVLFWNPAILPADGPGGERARSGIRHADPGRRAGGNPRRHYGIRRISFRAALHPVQELLMS